MSIDPYLYVLGFQNPAPMLLTATNFRHIFPDDSTILRSLIFTAYRVADAELESPLAHLPLLDHMVFWVHWTWQRLMFRAEPFSRFTPAGQATLNYFKLHLGPEIEAMEAARQNIVTLLHDSANNQHSQIHGKASFIKESLHRAWVLTNEF